MTIYAITAIAVLVSIALALARAIIGPTSYDRILSVNAIGTKTVLLIGVMGFLGGRPDFLDLALVYALVNFIGTLAVLKYFKFGTLRGTLSKPRDNA
ncbi:MAG: monovalent cation/H+ antiporter complex subunit F [Sneathiella sp.]